MTIIIGKGVKPVEVLAWGDTLVHTDKTAGEDNAVVLLRFENGALGQSEISWIARGSLDLRNEIYGTEGSIFTDVANGALRTLWPSYGELTSRHRRWLSTQHLAAKNKTDNDQLDTTFYASGNVNW